MVQLNVLSKYAVRHAISVGFAVLLSVIVNYYFMHSNECWMVLAAFIVGQTTRGNVLRQGLMFIVILVFAAIVASVLKIYFTNNIIAGILGLVFIVSAYLAFVNRPISTRTFLLFLIFAIVLFFATLMPSRLQYDVRMQVIDIVIGGVIGLLCVQFIFPVNLEKEFRLGLIPILEAIKNYANALMNCFTHASENELHTTRLKLEKILQTQYPEWIYEPGFNPGLRSGFRFYLVNLERITEILFSMNYLICKNIQEDLLKNISQEINVAMQKNIELLDVIIGFLDKNTLIMTQSDYTGDVAELEKNLQQVVPDNLDLLDLSPGYITLTTFVRDIKDMRNILLQLVMALPATRSA